MMGVNMCTIILILALITGSYGQGYHWHCPSFTPQNICESLENLYTYLNINTKKLLEWEKFRPFVERFSERWKKEITDVVESFYERFKKEIVDMVVSFGERWKKEIVDFVVSFGERWKKEIFEKFETRLEECMAGRVLPKPESLISKVEDGIQNDWVLVPRPPEDGSDIVSNLLAKVEKMENRTIELEEELKSERRVRRHLEQEVKETRSSLIFLRDQLQNVTVPVDAMMDRVEMVLFTSLKDMNKTIYEDHLKKLYYKVDNVVYKNETKKLNERLEHVEIELHNSDNSSIVSKLAEDIKTLEDNLYLLNSSIEDTLVPRIEIINNSIGDVLVPRLETLETETVRKNATEELEDKMSNLLNNTELFRNALVDVWSDIQDIHNFERKFQNFSEQWSMSLKELQNQVEFLKHESLINRPTNQMDDTDETNEISQEIMTQGDEIPNSEEHITWDLEDAAISRIAESGSTEDVRNITWHPNISGNSTNYGGYSTWEPEITTGVLNRPVVTEYATTNYEESTSFLPEVTTNIVDRGKIDGSLKKDSLPCEKPEVKDHNLLADVVRDSYGNKHLKFGCRPIGLYAVSHLPVPPRCERGSWKGPFPSCTMLSNISTIEGLAKELLEKNPCLSSSVEFPDPTNCSQFLKCSHGKASVVPCPSGLHFNARLKVCDYPRTVFCTPAKSVHDQKLQGLIPPILVEPDNVDRPGSHLGTGSTGQLIVHPRSSFTLHCLFPENIWGYPKWDIAHTYSELNQRHLVPKEGKNRVSLTVTAATEGDSGIYRCLTPFGVQHAVEVVVRERKNDSLWNCKAFDSSKHPDLILERNDEEKKITFRCAGGKFLIGNSFTRCRDDGVWSHTYLPQCIA